MPKPDDGRVILKFDVGDVIDLLNTEDPNWWEVKLQTLNFRQHISSIDLCVTVSQPVVSICVGKSTIDLCVTHPVVSICVGNWTDFRITNYWIGIAKLG